jgi:hypothetical protein
LASRFGDRSPNLARGTCAGARAISLLIRFCPPGQNPGPFEFSPAGGDFSGSRLITTLLPAAHANPEPLAKLAA